MDEVKSIDEEIKDMDEMDMLRLAYRSCLKAKLELAENKKLLEEYKQTVLTLQNTVVNQAGRIDKLERKLKSLNAKQNI